jgi:RNA-directed DNA polymerase
MSALTYAELKSSTSPGNNPKKDNDLRGAGSYGECDSLTAKAMKRINNLYHQICSIENLQLADAKACMGKARQYGVQAHIKNREANILALHEMLKSKTYRTSPYTTFTIHEPKERLVYRLPFFPDRITHHAVMNVLEPVFVASFTADSYSCIKGKGIHAAARAVRKALADVPGTQYCLKLDVTKFYPNVDHNILKQLLRRKIKDQDLLWLLDEIIDSTEGLPIGNYLSQYFANFYLTYFDHWLKETKQVRYYFRYADDLVFLSDNKPYLHALLADIREYLGSNLRLQVKENYQVFPVSARGIDFVGYVFYHTHTRLRKTIKKSFARKLAKGANPQSIASYAGWAKHADCKNLIKKLLNDGTIQGLRDKDNIPGLPRGQNQHSPDTQPRDLGAGLQNRKLEIRGQRQMSVPADTGGGQTARSLHRLKGVDGNHRAGTQGQIPFPHHYNP